MRRMSGVSSWSSRSVVHRTAPRRAGPRTSRRRATTRAAPRAPAGSSAARQRAARPAARRCAADSGSIRNSTAPSRSPNARQGLGEPRDRLRRVAHQRPDARAALGLDHEPEVVGHGRDPAARSSAGVGPRVERVVELDGGQPRGVVGEQPGATEARRVEQRRPGRVGEAAGAGVTRPGARPPLRSPGVRPASGIAHDGLGARRAAELVEDRGRRPARPRPGPPSRSGRGSSAGRRRGASRTRPAAAPRRRRVSAASAPRASVTHCRPHDHAAGLEPVDQPRDPAPRQQHPVRERAHPEPAIGRVDELEQRVVLGEREPVRRLQLLVQPPEQARVGMDEARHAPRRGSSGGVAAWIAGGVGRPARLVAMADILAHPRGR